MRLGKFTQADGERKRYTIDYSEWLDTGETVSSVTYAVSPATVPPMVVDGSQVNVGGLGISFYVSGGVDQNQYKVIAIMTTSAGQIKEDHILFTVSNP